MEQEHTAAGTMVVADRPNDRRHSIPSRRPSRAGTIRPTVGRMPDGN